MEDENKTKKQLINELLELRQQISTFKSSETQLKQLEKKLQSTKIYLESILSNSPDLIITIKKDGTIGYTNHLLDEITGYREDEVLGKYFFEFVPEHQKELVLEKWRDINEGIPGIFETEIFKADGTLLHCLISSAIMEGFDEFLVSIKDITKRKRAEKALIESEEHFRRMVNAITSYTYSVEVKDGQAVSTRHSIGCLPVTGYKPKDYESEPYLWYSMIHPEDHIIVNNSLSEIMAGREIPPIEHRLIRRDGTMVWVRNTMVPYLEEEGRLVRYDGLIEDITDRKHAEAALRESEEKFRAISNTAVDAILVMNNEGKISYWNPAAEKMFGYTSEETIGKELHLFLAPERYHEDYKKGFSKFKETGQGPAIGNTLEFFALRKDRIEFPIEVSTSAIQIEGQWHSVGIVRDITERKIAEKALRESEQNYRALFEESKDVVYISTPEGKFLDINHAGVELFGYSSKEELLRIDIVRDLYTNPDDREKLQQILAKQGFVKDYEVLFKKKDGEHVIVLLTTTIVRDEIGNALAYRGIMKDITERKKLQEQLLQAQKMEAIGQLAGGIAHDFNNILTAIIGFGNLLKIETIKDDLLRSYVTQILNSAERAANLTQALLAFSRRQIISPKPINLNEIIEGVESLLRRLIGEDIELSTFLTDKQLTVMADTGQIEQVLMNLATNARDAMPDGGSLIIKTDISKFDNEFIKAHGFGRPGSYALISVEDTGQGMDEKTKERIFEPFFTTKEVGKGTGLGLSMVYGIIKQHDGYINVYSELGEGTIFKIFLPLIKLKFEEPKPAELTTLKRGAETILVAEDDTQVRELIKEVLTGFGYKVLEAADGEDAIRIFNENKENIQLLIFDVIMPKKNGKEVYDDIKKSRPDIKALFTSGYDADIIHKKGILDEGLDFILKPISPDDLLRKVREVLDK